MMLNGMSGRLKASLCALQECINSTDHHAVKKLWGMVLEV